MNERVKNLIKESNAYKIAACDKRRGTLSHAYLIVCSDGVYMRDYLKIFASLIMCSSGTGCGECRPCRLIEKEAYADCDFYPQDGDKIRTADVDDMIPKTIVKPIENDLRLFVFCGAETMTAEAQNKILKTLEEPPRNVCIFIGATSDYNLLSTVKSRVKRLDIPPFSDSEIRKALSAECPDKEKLDTAIELSGGRIGETIKNYRDAGSWEAKQIAEDVLFKMKSSKDAAKYVCRITKDNVRNVITILKSEVNRLIARDMSTAEQNGYTLGALVAIEDMLTEKEKALYYNANAVMVADGILLAILGEKYRWQRL